MGCNAEIRIAIKKKGPSKTVWQKRGTSMMITQKRAYIEKIIEIYRISVQNNAVYHCKGEILVHLLTSNNISTNLVGVGLRLKFDKFSTNF